MRVSAENLTEATLHLVESGRAPAEVVEDLKRFSARYHLSSLLPEVTRRLKKAAEATRRYDSLVVQSPEALSSTLLAQITERLGAEGAPLLEEVAHTNLGGFQARYKDRSIDASFETALRDLHHYLNQ